MEPVEGSESDDYLSFYTHRSSSMKIPTFNLFDTMAAAGIYDSTVSSSFNGNNKTNLHHTGQHIYSTNNDYTSSISTSNEYWPYLMNEITSDYYDCLVQWQEFLEDVQQ